MGGGGGESRPRVEEKEEAAEDGEIRLGKRFRIRVRLELGEDYI